MTIKFITVVLSCNHCCSGKSVSITYSVCVSAALAIQDNFWIEVIEHIMCVLYSSTMFEKIFILRKIQ